MEINILTIFRDVCVTLFGKYYQKSTGKELVNINILDIRDFTKDKHRSVDDYSYGWTEWS